MDKKYIKNHNVIERYLLGQLEGEELDKFSLQLMRDSKLQEEVNANRLLYKTVWKSARAGGPSFLKKNRNRILWMSVLIFSMVALYLFLPKEPGLVEQSEIPEIPSSSEAATQKGGELPASDLENSKIDNTQSPSVDKPQTPPINPEKGLAEPRTEKPKKVFAANFEENPLLENLKSEMVRGENLKLLLNEYAVEISHATTGIELPFSGRIETDNNSTEPTIRLYIFDNKEANYKNFKPVWKKDLALEKVEGGFQFSVKDKIIVDPGLYYVIFEDVEEVENLWIGKLIIVQE